MEENCLDLTQPISLVMAYVKKQSFGETYDGELALTRGTAFPDLDFPLLGEEVTPRGGFDK